MQQGDLADAVAADVGGDGDATDGDLEPAVGNRIEAVAGLAPRR
jgi:hypothetical protein